MIQRFVFRIILCAVAVLSLSALAVNVARAAGSVQGFGAAKTLQIGTIVQLAGKSADQVEAATTKKLNQMYGVVVDPQSQSLTISDGSVSNATYVTTAGTFTVLVSSQGGAIKSGDYITLSAIDGVGMKAGNTEKIILGRAAGTFDGKNNTIGTVALKDSTGKQAKSVTLGTVSVVIDIKHNPNEKSTKADVPPILQRLGEAIAEKPVGPLRIYLSIGITGISLVAAIIILYGGVRNSIISIGRNPLSKKAIFRGLLEIVLTSVIVLIVGLFAVYLLLKL